MIKSVTVKNFKPHEDTTVEFPSGVTVITGVSDEGKSAFYQALKWPILNKPNGSAFHSNWINKDKVVTEVAIRTEENRLIQRIKKKGYDVYILNGNKDDPFAIREKATFENPHQYAEGMSHVYISGVSVLANGQMTGARPGSVLRSNQ